MVLGRRKTYTKKIVQEEPAQEEPKTIQNTSRPPGGYFAKFGFFLGRLPFGGDHFLTTFLVYVLRRPKTIILPLFRFRLNWTCRGTDLT